MWYTRDILSVRFYQCLNAANWVIRYDLQPKVRKIQLPWDIYMLSLSKFVPEENIRDDVTKRQQPERWVFRDFPCVRYRVGDPDIFKFNSTVSEAYPWILGEHRMCDVVTLTRVAPPNSRACHETIKLIWIIERLFAVLDYLLLVSC